MTFVPTPFATPVLSAFTQSEHRSAAYLSLSDYRFEPTAVGTKGLVPGSTQQSIDSPWALAQVIEEASQMIDDHCFHDGQGSLVSTLIQEQDQITPKANGALWVICNQRPIRQIVGVGVGPSLSQMANISPSAAANIAPRLSTFVVPGGAVQTPWGDSAFFPGGPFGTSPVFVVWTYTAGWAHTTLAESAAKGDDTITVNPSSAGASVLWGAVAGTTLRIKDASTPETVVLAATPTSTTLSLASPLQYAHAVPQAPDSLTVTAMPQSVIRACVALTSFLLKTRGVRSQVPASVGAATPAQRQAMGRSGAAGDFDLACELLRPYRTVYVHG